MKNIRHAPSILLAGLLAAGWSCGGSGAEAALAPPSPAATPAAAIPAALPGANLRPFQRELLQLAFDAASALPLAPHGKNRSRAQDQVVVACFELGEPELALAFGTRIADWRRGGAYADYAASAARAGDAARARDYVELATAVAVAEKENTNAQEWRRDLILLKVARVHGLLGDEAEAAKVAAGIDATSANAVDSTWAATAADRLDKVTAAGAADEFAAIDKAFPAMSLGQQNVAVALLARLHEKFFADRTLRSACEQRLAVTWAKLVPALRLEALARLVRTNLAHGESAAAGDLLATMRALVAGHRWRPEDRVPQVSRLSELAAAVGDLDRARADAEAALATYHQEREGIVDIYRARTLRPLALAWFAIGDVRRGEELLTLVIEEGQENPNSRPRCDDLVDTCVALCKRGIEPSPALWARLREIQRGLGNPW